MARVVVSYFSDYGEAMYDAISDVLLKNGNDVFRFNINNSKVSITSWGGESEVNDKKILKQIKDFKPTLILSFNNCLPKNCYNILPRKCKICVLDADAPSECFWNKDMLFQHLSKFLFLGLQSYSKTMYENYLGITLTNETYIYFPPATIIKKENLAIDKNISFIGSNFYPLQIPTEEYFYTADALKIFDKFKKDYFHPFKDASKNFYCTHSIYDKIRHFYAGQDRLKYMQQLTDLGFVFYGVRNWNRIACYDFELAQCFDAKTICSIEENQWVHNTSKVSVNFSHPLAKSSFSWRVMDIMASNSCLLMEDKPDWRDLFAKYLSKDVLDVIIYKDRFDMRQKAIKLLSDENLRQRCVKELNNAIEQNGRWNIRFKSLEKFLGIKLLNLNNEKVNFIFVQREESIQKSKHKFLSRLKLKNRFKIFVYSLLLALYQIPILDIGIRHKQRDKILEKISKYWR